MDKSKQSATEPTIPNERFVSCIKIRGYRILPPLLNEAKRAEMQRYRVQAIEVEQKLKLRNTKVATKKSKDMSRRATLVDSDNLSFSDSVDSSSDTSSNDDTSRSAVVFDDHASTDVLDMLKDFKIAKSRVMAAVQMPSLDTSAINHVPLIAYIQSDTVNTTDCKLPMNNVVDNGHNVSTNRIVARRQDTYTVTNENQVFSENVLKELINTPNNETSSNRFQRLDSQNSSINDSISENKVTTSHTESIDISDPSVNTSELVSTENKENDSQCMPYALIRSNSYIVDTPSPMLLAQMQENNVQLKSEEGKTKETVVKKRRSWDLKSAKEKWSSTDLNLITSPVKVDKETSEPTNIGKSASNSLPNSSVPSPNVQMFNSDTIRRVQSQKLKSKLSNLELAMKESSTDNSMSKSQVKSVLKTPETQRKFVENFVTPMRNWKPNVAVERLTPKHVYSERKAKLKVVNTFTKTDISLSRPQTLVVQRRTSVDESNISTNPPTKLETCIAPKPPDKTKDRIRDILDRIQSEQSKQMAELLDRQQKEQKNMMRMFAAQQALLLTTLKNNQIDMSPMNSPKTVQPKAENTVINTENSPADYNVSNMELELLRNSENVMAECKKLLKSTSSSYTTASSPDDTLADLTIRSEQNDCYSPPSGDHVKVMSHSASAPQHIASDSNKFNRSYSDDSLEPGVLINKFVASKESRKQESAVYYNKCNRQLFPTERQIWAAKKICALARGYLIRRLMKTERVQNLILTIKDTLLCAMDLHHETAETIRPADVELHRRLIQQVTAACYSFHEMFFGLSKAEQMAVIAADRERLKEKAMRPASARSTTSVTSTTQRVLERKMRRASNDGTSAAASRSSSSRSCHSVPESRTRTKSLGLSDSLNSTKKTSPQNDVMRRAMSYGANKKPWR